MEGGCTMNESNLRFFKLHRLSKTEPVPAGWRAVNPAAISRSSNPSILIEPVDRGARFAGMIDADGVRK